MQQDPIQENAMAEVPGSSGGVTPDQLGLALDPRNSLGRPPVASAGSAQHKSVRFGTHEPPSLTVMRRCMLPLVVVVVLANCLLIAGEALTLQFWGLSLIAFLVSALVLSPSPANQHAGDGHRTGRSATRLLVEWFCVALVLLFVSVAFKLTQTFPRDVILTWLLGTPLALLLTDSLSEPLARRLAGGRSEAQRDIIIGANDVGLELARRLERTQGAGRFFGFLDFRSASRLPEGIDKPVTASCSAQELADFVRRHYITRVYLALPILTTPRIEELIKELRDTTASIYFAPNIFAFDLLQARCVDVNGMPVLSICDSPFHGMSSVWKRAFDIALALLVLLLGWPAFLVLGLAIKVSSPGPVLFKQRRYGLNGEEILVYKFRSMTVCEDGPVVAQAVARDHRVTRLGSFLRRTSFDELPQILNVLEGKMSFVGPRPHAVAHNEQYRRLISGYMVRHKVRPGITGWAQVNGLRGETRTVDMMHRRVQYDIDYLKNWSLGLDLKIIVKTAVLMLKDRNAY
jgi:putative colanic acid biosynthesis UDP-glucose lipid carrier transferase